MCVFLFKKKQHFFKWQNRTLIFKNMKLHLENSLKNKMQILFFCARDATAVSTSSSSAKKVQVSLFLSHSVRCCSQLQAQLNVVDSDLHTTAQERGSLKGLLPVGTPTSRASLPAFCRQYCWSSAAACDTCEHRHGHMYLDGTTL